MTFSKAPTRNGVRTPCPTDVPPLPRTFEDKKYYGAADVAKIIGVDKRTVTRWNTTLYFDCPLFTADVRAHDGTFLYEVERVMQLKAVYHKDWTFGGYQPSPTTSDFTLASQLIPIENGVPNDHQIQSFKQNLENLPDEIFNQPRFFEVGADKIPHVKDWSNPANQRLCTDIQGLAGFDTTGHGIAVDYLFFDFDHILNENGEFVNDDAARWFNYIIESLESFCEISISKEGAHILATPSPNKFQSICAGTKGTLYFDTDHKKDSPKLEIFYKTSARYCLVTGNLFCCEAKTPIASGEIVDSVLETVLAEIQKRLPTTQTKNVQSKTIVHEDGTEYELFRAELMLDTINPADLADTEWLTVISACKNIGIDYATVDNFNHRDPDRYNAKGNESRWNSISNTSIGMGALYNIAARFGYDEKSARRQWYQLHPDLKPSASKEMRETTKKELDEAIIFLDNLSAENFSADDAYNKENLHFVALAQTYGFIASTANFFATIKEAKALAKNRISESKNNLTAPMNNDELKKLNALLAVSVDRIRKIVNSDFQELKQKQKEFQKAQKRLRQQEKIKAIALQKQKEIENNINTLADLVKEYDKYPTEDLADKIRALILNSCDYSTDKYTGEIKFVRSTASNADLIFSHDPTISGMVGFDEFQQANVFIKQVPWRKDNCVGKEWTDKDDAELRAYLRRTYTEFAGKTLIDDWLTSFSNKHSFHAVKNYFKNLPKWDGTPRAETLFIKFLRVKDSPYAREVTLNWLLAAIARIFHPGCRYQTALVLHGAQGIGKSYIIERLGGQWYSAIIDNVDDPHAIDALKVIWLGEFKEMAAMRKAELNAIKSFIERSEDNRRAAYERRTSKILRHCVFVITVNDDQFLSDTTGNRRYMILHCESARLNYIEGLTDEYIQQVWAEVFQKYNEMFDNDNAFDEKKLALSPSAQVQAEDIAQNYMRDDGTAGEINAFLNTKIPPKVVWNLLTKEEHRQFAVNGFIKLLDGESDLNTRRRARGGRHVQQDIDAIYDIFHGNSGVVRKNTIKRGDEIIDEWFIYGSEYRQHICAAEIFNECFGNDRRKSMTRIHETLNNLEGWSLGSRIKKDPIYGDQKKVFYRDKPLQQEFSNALEATVLGTENFTETSISEDDLPF